MLCNQGDTGTAAGLMRRWSVLAIIAVFLVLTGCSRVQVSQDYKAVRDFSRFSTYRWKAMVPAESEDIRVNNPLLQERFRQAIDGTLAVRGYVLASRADFLVSYDYSIQTRLESEPYGTSVGLGMGQYYRYGGVGIATGVGVRQYDVGVLVIDFFDGVTGEPVWRGTGTELVRTHSTPEETTAFVYRMVDAILAQFPPR